MKTPRRGFTLVELIVTLVLFGTIAATLTLFFRPAFEAWMAARSRATLADQAGNAVQRMLRDVRAAVPNSIRTPNTSCFELVPTISGGRYRRAVDTVNAGSAAVDPAAATSSKADSVRRAPCRSSQMPTGIWTALKAKKNAEVSQPS